MKELKRVLQQNLKHQSDFLQTVKVISLDHGEITSYPKIEYQYSLHPLVLNR